MNKKKVHRALRHTLLLFIVLIGTIVTIISKISDADYPIIILRYGAKKEYLSLDKYPSYLKI